ncbi:MAG: uroporphyrinogen-III synthase [Lamprobacter sp.]|uniref:uroporphyrinogen-III synthase n=1 Tax=Lamprobacter sp. TaxID=3100796 RepID=UPI002B2593CA|nr:uroporphyrinogen-III synthase [Lamprobacter sp.]MEA3639363.1 uroporphyrinogen-III synthase [Lamprobacter sp.]
MSPICPLKGRGVLVTRPAGQAEHLCQLIREAEGEPIEFPTLEIRAASHPEQARQRLAEHWDLMLFVSRNAVEYGIALFPSALRPRPGAHPGSAQHSAAANSASPNTSRPLIGAVGRATAAALKEQGLAPDLVPERGFDSEALLALPALTQVAGKRVLIVRGEGGRPLLGETLHQRGAEVAFAEVYRRALPDVDVNAELASWRERLGFVTATSDEVLQNLLQMIGPDHQAWLLSKPLVVISDRGGATAMQLGFRRVAVAEETSDEGIVDALCRLAMSLG